MRWWLVSIIPHCPSCCWEADGPFGSSTETVLFAERYRRGRDHTVLLAQGRIPAIEAAIHLREEDRSRDSGVLSDSRSGYGLKIT